MVTATANYTTNVCVGVLLPFTGGKERRRDFLAFALLGTGRRSETVIN
jgi:hypothetical protein